MVKAERNIPAGLYVHIPFCVKKCAYCDFLSFQAGEEVKNDYVNLLCREIEQEAVRYPDFRGTTVFFGGGTPTVLAAEQLEKILCKLKECFLVNLPDALQGECTGNKEKTMPGKAECKVRTAGGFGESSEGTEDAAEITLECNPGTVTKADLQKLRAAGFNRISIGLQSAQNEELQRLGRIHTWEDFLMTYDCARKAGFQNINVDIMSALPGQNIKSYVNTIERVTVLRPEHISAYSLIIEEGTPFYEWYGEADAQRRREGEDEARLLPSEEEERRMYELTQEMLERKGYHRYEISNYALPGYACRHNITYWKRGNYLGFGLGAASLMENCRFVRPGNLTEYREFVQDGGQAQRRMCGNNNRKGAREIALTDNERACLMAEDLYRDVQRLSVEEQMEEFMFLGLRLTEGISAGAFRECFHISIEECYGDVMGKLERQGLLMRKGDRIFLTERGIDVSNVVLAEFLL